MKFLLTTVLSFSLSVAASAGTVTTNEKPVCTSQNSPLQVIFGTCKLVEGTPLYANTENLTSLSSISSSLSSVSSFSTPN